MRRGGRALGSVPVTIAWAWGMTSEFRRGWTIILAAATGIGMGATGLPFYTFGTFVAPVAAEFGWSRGTISFGSLCLTMGTFTLAPFVGALVDRVGARPVGLASLTLLAVAYLLPTMIVESPATWYASWGLLALAGSGTGAMVWTKVVALWFRDRRGLALGLTLAGTGIAGATGPLFVSTLNQAFGWRGGFYGLSAITLAVAVPVVAVLFRAPPRALIAGDDPASAETGQSLAEAIRRGAFWRVGLGFLLASLGITSMIVHLVPLVIDRGLAPPVAASLAGALGIAVIAGRLACGALVDRFSPARVAGLFLALPAIGAMGLAHGGGAVPILLGSAILVGGATGAEVDLIAFLTARLFGLRYFGAILGWELAFFGAGAAIGPSAQGVLHDRTGDYAIGMTIAAACCLVGAALIASIGRQADRTITAPVADDDPVSRPVPGAHH